MRLGAFINEPDFQRSGAAQNFLGLGCILHARQLHHHPVRSLLLDDGLGHPQLIDPLLQGQNVLLDRRFLEPASLCLPERSCQHRLSGRFPACPLQFGCAFFHHAARLVCHGGICETGDKCLARALHVHQGNAFLAQQVAHVSRQRVEPLAQGCFYIHLQGEMHPAP